MDEGITPQIGKCTIYACYVEAGFTTLKITALMARVAAETRRQPTIVSNF
jgi:hypothetical protein